MEILKRLLGDPSDQLAATHRIMSGSLNEMLNPGQKYPPVTSGMGTFDVTASVDDKVIAEGVNSFGQLDEEEKKRISVIIQAAAELQEDPSQDNGTEPFLSFPPSSSLPCKPYACRRHSQWLLHTRPSIHSPAAAHVQPLSDTCAVMYSVWQRTWRLYTDASTVAHKVPMRTNECKQAAQPATPGHVRPLDTCNPWARVTRILS